MQNPSRSINNGRAPMRACHRARQGSTVILRRADRPSEMPRREGRDRTPQGSVLGRLLVLTACALTACGGSRALAPDAIAGAAGTTGGSAGATGSGESVGTAGAGGFAGAGGMAGAAGTTGVAGNLGSAGTAAPTPLRISAREALARMAAVLWRQAPDEDLLSQAAGARVTTSRDLERFARLIVNDERAAMGVGAFYRWWLDLDAITTTVLDPTLFPEFTPELQADMAAETESYGVDVTLNQGGTFLTLLTEPSTWLNERLASLYKISGVTGPTLRSVSLPSIERAGLLTQPSVQVLGAYSKRNSPSHKGTYILRKFFCLTLPSAPANIPGLDPISPGVTVRQALANSVANTTECAACHVGIDPPGLALERFDAIGRARSMDNGLPIDTGNLRLVTRFSDPPSAVIINGPVDLANAIGRSDAAEACFAKQWLTFALGRDVEARDAAALDQLRRQFSAADFSIKELIVNTLLSDSFLSSTPP